MESIFNINYFNTPDFTKYSSFALQDFRRELFERMTNKTGEYKTHEEFLRLPLDTNILLESKRLAERYYSSQLKYILVIGIGGSNLGTKAVYDALRGPFDNLDSESTKILFLDTTSASILRELEDIFSTRVQYSEEILINLISKSGTTTESIVNFELIVEHLKNHVEHIEDRIVCTTDATSKLAKYAEKNNYGILAIPEKVGGRFSVFSGVGLFPLLMAGIDVEQLRLGASEVLAGSMSDGSIQNDATRNAEAIFASMQTGVSQLNIFHFNPELESLGKWERQLVAESLGKEKNISGKIVHAGITPIVSIGSTDLHSMAQLYFGGPKDKFTMLIRAEEITALRVRTKSPLETLVTGIGGKSPSEIMNAILVGVRGAYNKNGLPYADVKLPAISPHTIGAYMQWRMETVVYLAALMHVNPFDQPNVEDYKSGTREILENNVAT